jgi:hypothetical protein
VRGDVLRTHKADANLKTCERYFSMRHYFTDATGEEILVERFAELHDILVVNIGDREGIMLLKAQFFQAGASLGIDLLTETQRLRSDLQWDPTVEDILEAKDVTNSVVVTALPYIHDGSLVVLDRHFDTLLIPE